MSGLIASGCAQQQGALPPEAPIDDLGWKAGTIVKPANTAAKQQPVTPPSKRAAGLATESRKSAGEIPSPKNAVGAGKIEPATEHMGGACGKLKKADCHTSCTWVDVKAVAKPDNQGYCTSARSF